MHRNFVSLNFVSLTDPDTKRGWIQDTPLREGGCIYPVLPPLPKICIFVVSSLYPCILRG